MGIADNERNTSKTGDLFRGALSVAPGDNNARGRIRRVDLADGVARLGIRGGSDGAGIQNNDVRGRPVTRDGTALPEQLPLDGGSIGLCGPAAKLFDMESGHSMLRSLRII